MCADFSPVGAATIGRMRFPVVLFDLDGTLIDSGAIILASMRHATRTVLNREIEDEILMATVGGAGLVEQMRLLDPQRVDELVRVYREHNEPLHDTLEAIPGILDVLPRLRVDGRRLGIVTAKRRETVALAFGTLPELEPLFDVVVGAEDTERHKPEPDPLLHALAALGARPDEAAYVGDSPFDLQAARAGGLHAVAVTWGGIHPEERLRAEEPDAVVSSAEELLDVL
jgi:pyrophosphatase PpaX